ncbi:MAG: hypothetical protein AAB649_07410, partial [Patescibacteria group bacterium]
LGGHQIIPVNEGSWLSGDAFPITGKEFLELEKETNDIFIWTYNEDNVDEHTVTVRLHVLEKKYLLPTGATEGILASLKAMFKKE